MGNNGTPKAEIHDSVKLNIGIISIVVMMIVQLVGFAYGYGSLVQQVAFNRELIKTYQVNQNSIMTKLDDLNARVSKVETLLQTIR